MLKDLPREFKDLLKNFYYQEGFIGFLDGLVLKDGLPYGRGIAVFNSIPNAIKENLSDLMFYFWDYQEKYYIPEDSQDISTAGIGSYVLELDINKSLKFVDKEDFLSALC